MFSSLFNKNKVEIKKISKGSHGDHWGSFFGFDNLNKNKEILLNHIDQLMSIGEGELIDRRYSIFNENLGDVYIKIITKSKELVSGFPLMHSSLMIPFESKLISEWSHVNSIEAQISGSGRKTFGLNFFATDYLENKNIYQNIKDLEINLSGFAYIIEESANLPDNFSQDFVSYMPSQQVNDSSVYDFIGVIIDVKKYLFENVNGYIISTKLINNDEMEDFFILNIFINKQNLKIKQPTKGMKITGCFWLQGNLAKS